MPRVQGRESSLNTISDLDLDNLEVGLDHVSRCSLLWKHLLNWKAENVAIEPESKKPVMGSTTGELFMINICTSIPFHAEYP